MRLLDRLGAVRKDQENPLGVVFIVSWANTDKLLASIMWWDPNVVLGCLTQFSGWLCKVYTVPCGGRSVPRSTSTSSILLLPFINAPSWKLGSPCLLTENSQDGASPPLVHVRTSSILATSAAVSTIGFTVSSFLCFVPPSFSYSLSPGKPSTGADWLACHLNRCPASKRGARRPLLPAPLSSRQPSLGFKKERTPLVSPGERIPVTMGISFMAWSRLLQETPFPYLCFPGHCCEFW